MITIIIIFIIIISVSRSISIIDSKFILLFISVTFVALFFMYLSRIDVNSKCNVNSSDTKKEDRNPITTSLLFVMMEMWRMSITDRRIVNKPALFQSLFDSYSGLFIVIEHRNEAFVWGFPITLAWFFFLFM